MPTIYNIRVGKPDTTHDAPAHVAGIAEGNAIGSYARQEGWLPDGKVTARASTGINARPKNPIDSKMPVLPPA